MAATLTHNNDRFDGIRTENAMKGFNGTPHATKSKPKSNKTRVKPRPAGADNLKAGKSK